MAEAVILRSPNTLPAIFPARNPFKSSDGFSKTQRSVLTTSRCSSQSSPRYAVLGAGFAGLSVAYHLLKQSLRESNIRIDIFDEVGLGGGASGVAGGLIHPYSPKAKLLWKGEEHWTECLELLRIAEEAAALDELNNKGKETDGFIVRRRGILRPATSAKNFNVLKENARNCIPNCKIQTIDQNAADNLLPNISTPCNAAFYLPEAVNINPQLYIQVIGAEYTAVVICLGAKADLLPELSGRLPLRTCRGVIAHLQLPGAARNGGNIGESPSILSDAWLAVQNSHSLYVGATWDWKSRNYSRDVSSEEASIALEELLPKASAIYPSIKNWEFSGAIAGVRAMPPLTAHNGSLPLLGCINNLVTGNGNHRTKFWLFGGLGSRGLLYHALLGKITAKAVLACDENLIPFELQSWNK